MTDIPAEAVEAGRIALGQMPLNSERRDNALAVLAAARPHIRARVLAEVDAALRKDGAFYRWWVSTNPNRSMDPHMVPLAADYLRDVLGADGEREEGT